MRLRRIAFWSGTGLLALVAFAISWLLLADLGSFKPQIERWASARTGRHIAINGALHIDLGRHSSIVAEDLHVGNPEWAGDTDFLKVGRVEVRVDLVSALRSTLIIELLDLADTELSLQQAASGERNWSFANDEAQSPDSSQQGTLLQRIQVARTHISYDSVQRAQPLDLDITLFSQQLRSDDNLDISFAGTVNGRHARLDGEVGNWAALLEQRNVRFDLQAQVDTFALSAAGIIDDLVNPSRPTLSFRASAPDINDLLAALGVPEEGAGVIDLSGSLQAEAQQPLRLEFGGQLGRTEIAVHGSASELRELDEFDLDVAATGSDVRPILAALGLPQAKPSPFRLNIDAQRRGQALRIAKADMLFGDAQLALTANLPHFPGADDASIQLQLAGPDIERFRNIFSLPGQATGAFSLGLAVDATDSGLEILNLDLSTSLLGLHATGSLGQEPGYFGTQLNFEFATDSLHTIAAAYGVGRMPDAPLQVEGSIEYAADGIRIREPLQANLGELLVRVDGLLQPRNGARGSMLHFDVTGPNLAAQLAPFLATPMLPELPFTVGGQLQIGAAGYDLRQVRGTLGSSALQAQGLLRPTAGLAGSYLELTASGPAFEELTAPVAGLEVNPGSYEFAGRLDVAADNIALQGVELHRPGGDIVLNLELGMPAERQAAKFDLRAKGPDVRSVLRGVPRFEARTAPFSVDVRGSRDGSDWTFSRLDVGLGAATLTAHGTLDWQDERAGSDFDLALSIPSTAALGEVDGRAVREQAFSLSAHARGRDGVLQVDDLHARLGDSDISARIRYAAGPIPELGIDISSDSIVFAPLLDTSDVPPAAAVDLEDGRLIPDIEVPFDALAKLNASINVDIGALQRDTLQLRNVQLRAGLQDGTLQIATAKLQAKSGAMALRGRIAPAAGAGLVDIDLVARDFAPGISELNRDMAMTGDLDLSLTASGTDTRALAGSASGVLFLRVHGGRIANNRFLQAIYGNMLDEILAVINPFQKDDPYTSIECVILPLQLDNGMVTSTPSSLISTDKIRILSKAEVNLQKEIIDLGIRTTPKKGIVISAGEIINPYINITGTLAAPRLAVDEKGVLLSGGAAVATGGLSILARATWDRLSRAKDPCAQTSEAALEALGTLLPDLELDEAASPLATPPDQAR